MTRLVGQVSEVSTEVEFNAQEGTSYTLVLDDAAKVVTFNNASPISVTIPNDTAVEFPVGTSIDLIQKGAGKVTVVAGGGVTINSLGTAKAIADQYVGVTLLKEAANTWYLVGNVTA